MRYADPDMCSPRPILKVIKQDYQFATAEVREATPHYRHQALVLEPTYEPALAEPVIFHWGNVISEALHRAETYKPSRGLGSRNCPHPVVALCRLLATFDAREGVLYRWERPCPVTQTT